MLQIIRFMKVCLQQQYQDYKDLIWYAMVTNQHPISPKGDMSTFFLWDNMPLSNHVIVLWRARLTLP